MMDGYGMNGGGWIVMVLLWVGILAVIVFALVRIFPSREDRSGAPAVPFVPTPERPLEILDRRLASGEIDIETYDRLRERIADATKGR